MATIETQSPKAQGSVALRLERNYDASPERVYNAWVNPEAMAKWFAPTPEHKTVSVDLDARVGGKYRIDVRNPAGAPHVAIGVFKEVNPPKKLVMTWAWEGNSTLPETLLTVEITPRGSGAQLVLTHELFPNEEARDNHNKGWTGCLASLDTFLGNSEK